MVISRYIPCKSCKLIMKLVLTKSYLGGATWAAFYTRDLIISFHSGFKSHGLKRSKKFECKLNNLQPIRLQII